MKLNKHLFLGLTLAVLAVGAWAQTPGPASAAPVTAADVQALKDALAAQQLQIDRLTQLLQRQQAGQPAAAQIQPVSQQQPAELSNAVLVQPIGAQQDTTPGLNLQDTQTKPTNPLESPVVSIHFRGITITPGGFVAAEFVRRSRALGADVVTPFNNVTMPGASQSTLSEWYGTARQSRPTIYVDGRLKNVEFSSYVSGDFLSSGDTSTATQTNSYTFRLRQAWGQAKFDNGWSILGGQAWSLVTENKAGIAPSDDLGKTNDARPMTIDGGYNVGFSFARQMGIRLTKDFNQKVAFAISLENAEGTLSTHSNSYDFLLGSEGATNTNNDAVSGCTLGTYTVASTGLPAYYTTCTPVGTYTFNPSPDLVAKVALDPGFGHYEIFGLWDRFRDRVFPCEDFLMGTTGPCPNNAAITGPSVTGAYNVSRNGGGFGANARWTFYDKHIVFGLHAFGGRGVGRYGAAQLPDMSIHADGAPNLIKNVQGLGTLEWHGKKLDVYFYTGVDYAGRSYDYDGNVGVNVGYGNPNFNNSGCYTEAAPTFALTNGFNPSTPGKCIGDTRADIEGTGGFWYRFYNGPRGRFQWGMQYSYLTKQTWSGCTSAGCYSPEGIDNMVFSSLRYYLP